MHRVHIKTPLKDAVKGAEATDVVVNSDPGPTYRSDAVSRHAERLVVGGRSAANVSVKGALALPRRCARRSTRRERIDAALPLGRGRAAANRRRLG